MYQVAWSEPVGDEQQQQQQQQLLIMRAVAWVSVGCLLCACLTSIAGLNCYLSNDISPDEHNVGDSVKCTDSATSCFTARDLNTNLTSRGCDFSGNACKDHKNSDCSNCWTDNCNGFVMEVLQCVKCTDQRPSGDCSESIETTLTNCEPWKACVETSYSAYGVRMTQRSCDSPFICVEDLYLTHAAKIKLVGGDYACKVCNSSICNATPFTTSSPSAGATHGLPVALLALLLVYSTWGSYATFLLQINA